MTKEMTSRERLLAVIEHKEPDKVPIAPRIWAWFLEYYGDCSWKTYLKAKEEFDFDPIIRISSGVKDYIRAGIIDDNCSQLENVSLEQKIEDKGDFIIVRKMFITPAGILTDEKIVPKPGKKEYGIHPDPEIREPLLKSPDDLPKIKFLLPDPDKIDYSHIKEIIETVGEEALVEVRPTPGSDALTIDAMGVEAALINSIQNKKFLEDTFEIFHQYNLKVTKRCLEAGAEVIFDSGFNMSLSVGWSPKIWKELFYPKVKEMCELTHSYGAYYHFYDDGKIMEVLPELAEIGVDILATCTPPPIGDFDLKVAKEKFGDKVCFKGGIDIVEMKTTTPERIKEKVAEVIKIGAPGGGFILSTSDSIRDGTPIENVKVFFTAGREYGKYSV
mgnify:CR=1 FL=1